MHQTLRTTFSIKPHQSSKSLLRNSLDTPVSLQTFLKELQAYINVGKEALMQPRQQVLDRILQEKL